MRLTSFLFILVCLVSGCDSNGGDPMDDDNENGNHIDYPSIGELAEFPVGVAIQSSHLSSSQRRAVIEHAFTSVTAEYEMKMNPIWSGLGNYNWAPADAIVSYAEEQGMQVHGHALLWHSAIPSWLNSFGGSDAFFEAAIEEYITDTVNRYKDRVVSWDVVNEAFEDNTGNLRSTLFAQRMGPDYVERMFQYARAADPDALLFYNDYALTWDQTKLQAVLEMVDDFLARDIPIDGVGLQMHVSYEFPDIASIRNAMEEIANRGLKVHLSELDVRMNPAGDQQTLTSERSVLQKARIESIVSSFVNLPAENRFAITMWGLADPDSWLLDFWGQDDWPLLFTGAFNPKPAYTGFVNALE